MNNYDHKAEFAGLKNLGIRISEKDVLEHLYKNSWFNRILKVISPKRYELRKALAIQRILYEREQ